MTMDYARSMCDLIFYNNKKIFSSLYAYEDSRPRRKSALTCSGFVFWRCSFIHAKLFLYFRFLLFNFVKRSPLDLWAKIVFCSMLAHFTTRNNYNYNNNYVTMCIRLIPTFWRFSVFIPIIWCHFFFHLFTTSTYGSVRLTANFCF